jgi:hypothetical protein
MEKNLYRMRYIVPLHDDNIGELESFEVKDKEIIITFVNPEVTRWLKKKDEEHVEKYHYGS